MMQNGAVMTDPSGAPTFHLLPSELSGQRDEPPSYQALEFYTDFANPSKETYTWNGTLPNSLDAFVQGRSAFFFGYAYQQATIKARAPKLNLGITKLPQIEGNPVKNIGNYWMWTVSKKTKNADLAWNFLNFLAKPDETKKVLDKMSRPAARKSLLADQLENEQVGVFASQVLTAQTWYRGNNPKAMEDAFASMIDDVVAGVEPINRAVRNAADKVSQTFSF
jgi:ABC-type glycerol-3-phosphate transport system substrate-binding protein